VTFPDFEWDFLQKDCKNKAFFAIRQVSVAKIAKEFFCPATISIFAEPKNSTFG